MSRRAAALTLAAAVLVPALAAGQSAEELTGRVVLGPDSTSVPGQTVVLHRVTADTGMAVDSATTGADGRFSLPLRGGSGDVFVVSARYAGVLYFGPAVHGVSPAEDYRVAVYEPREIGPADTLRLSSRALVLTPGRGGVSVTDVVQASGPADRTLVGRVPAAGQGAREPWWSLRLPEGARNVAVLPGGIGSRQVELASGEARLSAPVPPTGVRVVLGYEVPRGGDLRLQTRHPVDHLEVVVRQDVAGVTVEGLEGSEEVTSGQHRYRRHSARRVEAGRTVTVAVAGTGATDGVPRATWIAAGLGLLFAAGAALAWRAARRPGEP